MNNLDFCYLQLERLHPAHPTPIQPPPMLKEMKRLDFHRIVTPAILYVLDRSAKNGVSITEVVRALRPRHGETFLRGGQAEDKKILGRFKESNRELLRHVDKDTLKEAEQFLCHPLSFGSRFKYWPPQRPPAR